MEDENMSKVMRGIFLSIMKKKGSIEFELKCGSNVRGVLINVD